MGKQGELASSGVMKYCQNRCSENWRRMAGGGDCRWNSKTLLFHGLRSDSSKYGSCRGIYVGKKHLWLQKYLRTTLVMFGFISCLLLLDSLMVSFFDFANLQHSIANNNSTSFQVQR